MFGWNTVSSIWVIALILLLQTHDFFRYSTLRSSNHMLKLNTQHGPVSFSPFNIIHPERVLHLSIIQHRGLKSGVCPAHITVIKLPRSRWEFSSEFEQSRRRKQTSVSGLLNLDRGKVVKVDELVKKKILTRENEWTYESKYVPMSNWNN